MKGHTIMDENELTGTQIAVLFGLTCAATAVAVGLIGRAISKKMNRSPYIEEAKSIMDFN